MARQVSITTLNAKIEKFENQVSRLEAKKAELAELRSQRDELLQNVSKESLREQLERRKAEMERFQALIDNLPEDVDVDDVDSEEVSD